MVAEKTKQDGGLRRDVSCDLTVKIVATLQDMWCIALFAVTSLGNMGRRTGHYYELSLYVLNSY